MKHDTLIVMVLVLSIAAAGCARRATDDDPARPVPVVLAASSLSDVVAQIDPDATLELAASNVLATRLREGGGGDVFASADAKLACDLAAEGLLDPPRTFARNRIVLVAPRTSNIRSLQDLRRDREAVIIMARAGVPAGDYARRVLIALGASDVLHRVRSHEPSVRAVTSKLVLGAADAGFAYATDALALRDELRLIELPHTTANVASYAAATRRTESARRVGAPVLRKLRSPSGQRTLNRAGFTAVDEPTPCTRDAR